VCQAPRRIEKAFAAANASTTPFPDALLNMEPEITLPESVRKRAEIPILRMLELSK